MKQLIKRAVGFSMKTIAAHCIPPKRDQVFTYEQAEQILNNHSMDPRSSCLNKNRVNRKQFDLTIIVPVYNVEKYLERCMQSIFEQETRYSFEVIAVNDGSTDSSPQILCALASKKNLVIIHQDNRGHSGARNTALQEVKGKYIMFVDSDDFLPETAVESLMRAAQYWNADIVQGGYYHVDQSGSRCLALEEYDDRCSVASNGVLAGMLCGKIYRAELWQNICFPEGYWYEDTIVTSILTHLASNIATISDMVYYYRQNMAGITKSSVGKPKSIDTFYVLRSVMNARKELHMQTDKDFYEHLIRLMILCFKRTKNEPNMVRKSMFSLFKKMLEEERGGFDFKVQKKYKILEKAILHGDYRKYSILCSLW